MKHTLKALLIIFSILLVNSSLFATCDIWIGTGFINHINKMDESEKEFYINGNPIKDTNELQNLNMVGPSLDLSIYPYYEIPVGIKVSNQVLFPIGINKDSWYRTYHADLKDRVLLSISYAQNYSDLFGLFADFGYEYNYNRTAKTNKKNSTEKPEYHEFENHGLFGEIGFLTTIENGYFKFGINYYHSLINNANSHDMVFAGGFKF